MSKDNIYKSTIMFTDIVGYSAMINKDQKHALKLLDTHDQIIEPIISYYNGNIIKKIGDSIFAEFSDPQSSINTAIQIQTNLKSRNLISEKQDMIQIRIGLHMGDVIRKDDDLFGHDVNLCSRIESIAPKGGIAASNALIQSIKNKIKSVREMGYIKLKNIIHPLQIYKIYIDSASYESESDKQLHQYLINHGINIVDMETFSIEQTFSMGILYINNLGSENDESIAYNLTNDIISDCEYINELRTTSFNDILEYKKSDLSKSDIGRKLEVDNVLKGSILKNNEEIQLSFDLININEGKVLWNEKWSELIINNKKIRKQILQSIIAKFNIDMPSSLENLYSEEITHNSEALEIYYKGKYFSDNLNSKDNLNKAKAHLQSAIDMDSKFVEAYSEFALILHRLGQFDSAESNLQIALSIAQKKNDEQGLASIYNVMNIVNNTQGKYKKARSYIEKALGIQINLNNKLKEAKFRTNYANCLNQLNKIDLALEQNQKAISIKESLEEHKSLGVSYGVMANTYYATGNFSNALEYATKSVGVFRKNEMTNFEGRLLVIISDLHMLLGQYDKMINYINEAEPIMQSFNDSFLLGKLEMMKSRKSLYDNDINQAITHMDSCIDWFEMAEQRPFIIGALIEKIKILTLIDNTSEIKKIIPKVEMYLNKLDEPENKPLISIMKGVLNDEDISDSINEITEDDSNVDLLFTYWYLAKYFAIKSDNRLKTKYHNKAKSIIRNNADKISKKVDKESFLKHEYYNKIIQGTIEHKEDKTKENGATSIFAFCPSCGFKNENNFAFCPSCGNDLKQ